MVDENLPPRLAYSLQELFAGEHLVVPLRKKFPTPGVKDVEWIRALGKEGGWAILSADVRLSRNQIEKDSILAASLVAFIMAPAVRQRTLPLQMARILTIWDMMVRQSELVSRGLFQFGIRSSKFTQL